MTFDFELCLGTQNTAMIFHSSRSYSTKQIHIQMLHIGCMHRYIYIIAGMDETMDKTAVRAHTNTTIGRANEKNCRRTQTNFCG